jgi:UDP-glucose 4-epimerase
MGKKPVVPSLAETGLGVARIVLQILREVFPSVPHKRSFEPHETLLAIEKARKILGYNP